MLIKVTKVCQSGAVSVFKPVLCCLMDIINSDVYYAAAPFQR